MLTNKQKLRYYKNKEKTDHIILDDAAEDNHIIYGARAINVQLPSYLKKHTDDWDILSKTPEKDALETEKKLDRAYGGDYFSIEKGQHEGTWKVKNNVTRKTTADYTSPDKKVPHINIYKNKYAKLGWIKRKIQNSLKNPNNAFRFDKDKEALQRIKLYEKEQDFLFGV